MDIRQALHHLGEITGQISTEDLLDNIFSKFCLPAARQVLESNIYPSITDIIILINLLPYKHFDT